MYRAIKKRQMKFNGSERYGERGVKKIYSRFKQTLRDVKHKGQCYTFVSTFLFCIIIEGHPDANQKVGRRGAEHVYSLTAGGLSSNPSQGSPNPVGEPSTPLALTLHTPVPRQMLLPPTSVWCGALVIQQA